MKLYELHVEILWTDNSTVQDVKDYFMNHFGGPGLSLDVKEIPIAKTEEFSG